MIFEIIVLFLAIIVLLAFSAFFSGSETSMMAINRYRLKHLVKEKNKSAKRVAKLIERTDRLLGVILIGNKVDTKEILRFNSINN